MLSKDRRFNTRTAGCRLADIAQPKGETQASEPSENQTNFVLCVASNVHDL
jgi:hypothetical protein